MEKKLSVVVDRPPKDNQEQSLLDEVCSKLEIPLTEICVVTEVKDKKVLDELKGSKVILLLGEDSLEYLLGIRTLKKARGSVLYSDKYDSKVIASYSYWSTSPKKTKAGVVSKRESARAINEKRLLFSDLTTAKSLLAEQETNHQYEVIYEQEREKFDRFIKKLQTLELISVDIEAHEESNWDVALTRLLGIGFSWRSSTGVYVVLRDQYREIDPKEFNYRIEKIKPILEDTKIKKIVHNCSYELQRFSYVVGINLENIDDTMLMHHLIDENTRHGLNELSNHFSSDLAGYKDESEIFVGKDDSYSKIPTGILGRRCCADCDLTLRLYLTLSSQLIEQSLAPLYHQIVMPHRVALTEGERVGTKVDIDELNRIDPIILEKVNHLREELQEIAEDSDFNPGSYLQVQEVFNSLKIPLKINPDTGRPITDVQAVTEIIEQTNHSFPRKLLKYRQFSKLYSTYIRGIREKLLPGNIIHTSFLVHGTVTGRLSSRAPNLQNLPTDSKMIDDYGLPSDISIRKLFIPRKNYKFIVSDGAQMELRLLAALSQDETLSAAFLRGDDIHTLTAFAIIPGTEALYNLLQKEPDREDLKAKWGKTRAIAKNVNFGIAYGRGAKSLAQELKISTHKAQTFLDGFFSQYPGVYRWIQQTIGFGKRNGYVLNLFGRRRRLPDLFSPLSWKRGEAERQAQNSPIQGSAADCTAIANIRTVKLFKTHNIQGGFRINIHDELVHEVHQDQVDKGVELIKKGWLDPIPRLSVPLDIQISVGDRWEH